MEWEIERRATVQSVFAEVDGRLQLTPDFLLTGRADRIDIMNDGTLAVLDYKTGTPPSSKQVRVISRHNSTLQAAMLRKGGFEKGRHHDRPAGLRIVVSAASRRQSRRREATARIREFHHRSWKPDKALAQLAELANRFASDDEPYRSFSRPMWVGPQLWSLRSSRARARMVGDRRRG